MTEYKKYLKYKKKYFTLKKFGGSNEFNVDKDFLEAIKLSEPANYLIKELPYLYDKNPKLIYESPDGNCLFRTFSRILYNNPENYDCVRKSIVEYLINNSKIWKEFLSDETPEEYTTRMIQNEEWGGHIEIMAFCNLYGCIIYVHEPHKPPFKQTSNNINDNNFNFLDQYEQLKLNELGRDLEFNKAHIYYNGINHYNTLVITN
jgi:hypothetical protein